MTFTQQEIQKIYLALSVPVTHHRYMKIPEVPAEYEEQVRTYLATIERVDAALIAIEPDVIANRVGDLDINPQRSISNYRRQGSDAVEGISRTLNLHIYHNKYQSSMFSSLTRSQITVGGCHGKFTQRYY